MIFFSGFDRLEGKSECSQLSVVTNFLFRSRKLSAQLLEEMCRASSKAQLLSEQEHLIQTKANSVDCFTATRTEVHALLLTACSLHAVTAYEITVFP